MPRAALAEGWRIDVPFADLDAVELTDGTIVAVATVPAEGGPYAVGKVAVRSRGFDDLVAITITPAGEITQVRPIGGPGLESRMALAAAGDHAVLLLGSTGPLDDGPLQLAAVAQPFDHPAYLLVDLAPTKGPVRATTIFDAGLVRLPHLAALTDGDIALVAQVRANGGAARPSSVIERRASDGSLKWERRMPATLWRVMPSPTDVAAFAVLASDGDESDVIALGDDGAEVGRLALREVNPVGGSGLGVDVLVRSGSEAMIYGAAGSDIGIGDTVVKRRRIPSQPFVVRWTGTSAGDVVDLRWRRAYPVRRRHEGDSLRHPSPTRRRGTASGDIRGARTGGSGTPSAGADRDTPFRRRRRRSRRRGDWAAHLSGRRDVPGRRRVVASGTRRPRRR